MYQTLVTSRVTIDWRRREFVVK